jgi:hypothetical protein
MLHRGAFPATDAESTARGKQNLSADCDDRLNIDKIAMINSTG